MSEDWLGYEELKKEIEKLRSQNARYREALKQYIDLNYYPDCGDVAREALKEVDDGKKHYDITDVKFKKYKCRKCGSVCQGIGMWFHKNPEVGIERDYKFCYVCWLNMHKEHCGEVDEVTDEKG